MFWGYFHDNEKDPGLFWEKDQGTIKEENYQTRIVPIINGWISLHYKQDEDLLFM